MRITNRQWNKMVNAGEVKTLPSEIGFLVFGQTMKVKVEWQGKAYLAVGWAPPVGKSYVELTEVQA